MGNVVHRSHKNTKQNMADMVSLDTCHRNDDEVNKQRFLLAHNLQPSQGQTRVESPGVEPHGSAMSRRSQEVKSSLPNGDLFQRKIQPNLTHVATPESELSDQSQPTSPSSSDGSSPGVTTAANGSGVAGVTRGVTQVAAVQPIISEPTPQNLELKRSARPANSLKGTPEPSQDNGLLKELLSSMDIPESILKTKITSLLMSDNGNDLTISDILKKVMVLSKTSHETSSETDKSTPGEANCSNSTNHSKREQNDNTELRKLLFANRSVARESSEHPDRALYSYPSVTPSQILTGTPLMRGRGRPPRRRGLRPDPQQHQMMMSRENGDTNLEPNPSMMPMPYGVRDVGTNLPIENGTVQNHPVLPPDQIAQTTSCNNNAIYSAAAPQYQPYPNEFCPDGAVFINENGRSRSHEATGFEYDVVVADGLSNGYGLPNPNELLNAQNLSRPFDTFHRPSSVAGIVEGNVTCNGPPPSSPEGGAVNYSVRPENGLRHAEVMNRTDPHPGLPKDNYVDSERTVNRKSRRRVGGSSRSHPTRDLGLPDLLKWMLEEKLDEVPAKRSKRNSNIPHLEKYDNECDSSPSNDNTNNNKDQNGNSFKKFDFATEELIRQLLISTIQSKIEDEKRKAKERRSDEHAEKSVTPDSHVDVVLYEASDCSDDLPTLVTDEAGNALDLSHHCSESDDVAVVGEECGALDLTYKTPDVKPVIIHEEYTESSSSSKVTCDKHFSPSTDPDVSPGLEFYGHGGHPVLAPSFTPAGPTQRSGMITVGEALPLLPPGPGRCVPPKPPSAGMPPHALPLPPLSPPPMHGNGPCYPIHHPECIGNPKQQRYGYFYPLASQQHPSHPQQQPSPSQQQLQHHHHPPTQQQPPHMQHPLHPQQHQAHSQKCPPSPQQYPQQQLQQYLSHSEQHPQPPQQQHSPQQQSLLLHQLPHPQQYPPPPHQHQYRSYPQQHPSHPQQHHASPQQHPPNPQQHPSHPQQHPALSQRQPPPSQQQLQQQQHSPTCCRFRQQQCSPWRQQVSFRGRFPEPVPRNVPPDNSRPPPQAYNSTLSMRQPPPNVTVYNNVPRNQHNMSHPVRYAQAPRPPTNAPRPLSYQQTPTVDGKTYQHQHNRGTTLGHLRPFLNNDNNKNNATQFQFAARSSWRGNPSPDANNNNATRKTDNPAAESPTDLPSSLRQMLDPEEVAPQPTPTRSSLLREYLATINSSPNVPPPSPVETRTSESLTMKIKGKSPPNGPAAQSSPTGQHPADRDKANSTPLLSKETTSFGRSVGYGRSKSADSGLTNKNAKEKSSEDRDDRPTCLDAIHSIIDGCFYNDIDDNDNSKNNKERKLI